MSTHSLCNVGVQAENKIIDREQTPQQIMNIVHVSALREHT